ncbi:major histocompatibility complex class I-related gene protein-like [Engraulis encrasicolus]|uniref:major histocompatibility complex class I-related gene protein-like n=1 Tax=Engraulis encrasicolus TaxID=184585 RepID=UPI002FD05102
MAAGVKIAGNRSKYIEMNGLAGCELLEDGKPGPMFNKDAYNGEDVEVEYYDAIQDSLHTDRKLPDMNSFMWNHFSPTRYGLIYHPNCIKFLKERLEKEKKRVLKKVKPRVRLLRQTLEDSSVRLTCLATGFYPRHINLTLLRDGQPVPDHQITGGELLPNGDETYQMRKSLEVSTEELQQHHYTCTAQHLSLDNKLDIDLGGGSHLSDYSTTSTEDMQTTTAKEVPKNPKT